MNKNKKELEKIKESKKDELIRSTLVIKYKLDYDSKFEDILEIILQKNKY